MGEVLEFVREKSKEEKQPTNIQEKLDTIHSSINEIEELIQKNKVKAESVKKNREKDNERVASSYNLKGKHRQ